MGFLVTRRGVEDNLEKIRVVLEMQLSSQIALLGRFVPKNVDNMLSSSKFFAIHMILSGKISAKELLRNFCLVYLYLQPLLMGKILYLYLAVSRNVVSSVLARADGTQHQLFTM